MDELVVVDAVMAGLGWVAVLLGAYLAVSAAASLLVHGLRLGRRAAGVVDAVTLPPVRRLVQAVVGTGLAAGALAGSTPAAASSDAPVPVMRRLADDAPQAPAPTAAPDPSPSPATATATAPPPPAPTPSPAPEWTIRAGDHFWHIAEDVLAERLQRAPSDAETDPYWRRLVAANRDRLADPGNPDLLFPGQVVLLPAS